MSYRHTCFQWESGLVIVEVNSWLYRLDHRGKLSLNLMYAWDQCHVDNWFGHVWEFIVCMHNFPKFLYIAFYLLPSILHKKQFHIGNSTPNYNRSTSIVDSNFYMFWMKLLTITSPGPNTSISVESNKFCFTWLNNKLPVRDWQAGKGILNIT